MFDICPVCYWEDDRVQYMDEDYEGGANDLSLNQARANFRRLGVSDPRYAARVRPALPSEIPKPN
jgi:hypothetical protein